MSVTNMETFYHERSDSDQSLDAQFQNAPYDEYADQSWQQNPLFDDSLFLPNEAVVHDKHVLQGSENHDRETKRQEVDFESEKKKPGRKPITNEPTTKRKAQNRAAQRAFRERKENHVKTLEARIAELEQQNNNQSIENKLLQSQLARLQSSSSFALSGAFTFNVPPPQLARADSAHRNVSPGSVQPDSVPGQSQCPSLCFSTKNSPQSSSEKEFNAASIPHFDSQVSFPGSQDSPSSSARPSLHDSGIYSATSQDFSAEANQFLSPGSRTAEEGFFTENISGQQSSLVFDTMDYRDVVDPLTNFDADPLLFAGTNIANPPLYDTDDLFSTFDHVQQLDVTKQEAGDLALDPARQVLPDLGDKEIEENDQHYPIESSGQVCPEAWRKIVTHPKFASFDLDALCQEFKAKNKCTQGMEDAATAQAWNHQSEGWDRFDRSLDEFARRSESGTKPV